METMCKGTGFGFSEALTWMKNGYKVAREGWNGKGQWVALQRPDENSKMTKPYFYIHPVDGGKVPWLASQTDLLAEDWMIVQQEGMEEI